MKPCLKRRHTGTRIKKARYTQTGQNKHGMGNRNKLWTTTSLIRTIRLSGKSVWNAGGKMQVRIPLCSDKDWHRSSISDSFARP